MYIFVWFYWGVGVSYHKRVDRGDIGPTSTRVIKSASDYGAIDLSILRTLKVL